MALGKTTGQLIESQAERGKEEESVSCEFLEHKCSLSSNYSHLHWSRTSTRTIQQCARMCASLLSRKDESGLSCPGGENRYCHSAATPQPGSQSALEKNQLDVGMFNVLAASLRSAHPCATPFAH